LIDIYNPTEISKSSELIELEKPYDIPYRIFVPLKIEDLLVASY